MEARSFRIFLSDWQPAPGRLPPDVVACAIGDVHGQLGHVRALTGWIEANIFGKAVGQRHLITLGDYVDRGPSSIGVLDYLGRLDPPAVETTHLFGNHDLFLDAFLHDATIDFDFMDMWLENGCTPTLRELGIDIDDLYRTDLAALQARARARLPADAAACLRGLQPFKRIGDYVFVHAGVHPQRALEAHDRHDLAFMREPFLGGEGWRHDFVVVHGHTVCGPDVRPHRIACDSGAVATGVLTCVEIEADRLRFVAATTAQDLAALDDITAYRGSVLNWSEVARA